MFFSLGNHVFDQVIRKLEMAGSRLDRSRSTSLPEHRHLTRGFGNSNQAANSALYALCSELNREFGGEYQGRLRRPTWKGAPPG